jgi:hypothetical protein
LIAFFIDVSCFLEDFGFNGTIICGCDAVKEFTVKAHYRIGASPIFLYILGSDPLNLREIPQKRGVRASESVDTLLDVSYNKIVIAIGDVVVDQRLEVLPL